MNLTEFTNLIKDQFQYGGKKYGLTSTRESTDELFDKHGKNWLIGTIDKYCYRYTNLKRERDLLKIATYMYILWLKRGFHIDKKRVIPIDTNIKTKNEFFDMFINKFKSYIKYYDMLTFNYPIESISKELSKWSINEWKAIQEYNIFQIVYLSHTIWNNNYAGIEKHDKDTYK